MVTVSATLLWMVLHMQPHTGTLMAMAHALERNRHTHSRHGYSHPEKDLPEPHSDTARQLVAQSHSHIHLRNGHVSKVLPHECPHYPAMYHSHGTSIAVIHHPSPSCTTSHHPRKTHSLFSCKHISHTDKYRTMYNHSPMWTDTAYLTHRNISTQFPFHTPRQNTYATFTQKTWLQIETRMLSGDIHSVTKSCNFNKAA